MKKLLHAFGTLGKYYLYGIIFQLFFLNPVYAEFAKNPGSLDIIHAYKMEYETLPVSIQVKSQSLEAFLTSLAASHPLSLKGVNKTSNNSQEEKAVTVEVTVSGTVMDSNGAPIPGVTVSIGGGAIGTATDLNGRYSLTVPEGSTLVFSFIGFETQRVEVGDQSIIDIVLGEHMASLDEVVVVGYGTQKKSEITSSISQVDGEDIANTPVSNVAMSLQGRASGVEMISDGTPGKSPNIRIRGVGSLNSSEPLIVLDGVPVSSKVLSEISPLEIKSVEILKDAASGAIYGTRAANGVVLVTTKSGNYNQKTAVRLSTSAGVNSIINKYPVTTGEQLYELKRERYTMDGLPIPDNVPWSDPYYNATRTDWQDEFFQNGVFQDYNLQISGGSDRNTFNASLNYRNEEGTQLNTWFERVNFSLRSTQKITDRFRVEENVRLAHTNDQLNEEGEGTSVGIYSAYRFHPSLPLRNEDGSWGSGRAHTELGDMWNPVYKTTEEWRKTKGLSAFVNLKGEYDITQNLTLVGNVAYQQRLSLYENFQNTTPEQSRSINYPLLQEGNSINSEVLGELFARYSQIFGSHDIAATFGSTVQYNTGSFMNMSGEGFSSVDKSQLVMSNADIINGNGGEPASTSLLSYFVRGTYNYGDKYYFSGILRADGSSRFAVGNQWGYFPALSAGWRISSESFMESDLISNLKINVGWGQLGNQNVAAFQYLNIYTKDQRYIINGENVTGTRLTSFANPDITWETTTTINALLELGLLNDKINLNVAYFDRQTTDMLIPSIKHFTSGIVNLPDANIGEMRNHGVELELSHNNVRGDFEYNIGVNATFLKNKLNRLYGESSFLENGISRTYEGEPIASFYGWKTDGVYQTQGEIDSDPNILADPRKTLITPGDIRFVDINGDNLVNESDRTRIGDGNPNLLMGIVLDLSYKGIGFSAVFSGAFGQELYDAMMMRGIDPTLSANMDAVAYQRWTGPGSTSKWPRMSTIRANDNYRFSELGLKNGDYLRMKDVNLSYTFPAAVIESFRIADLRVYISGRNLLTFTDFDGVDPEETGRSNLSRGVILNNYPQSKTIILGLNLTF